MKNTGEGDMYTMMTGTDRKDFVKVEDGYCVYRVTDPKKQHIIIQRRVDNEIVETKEYSLYGLTLQK